MKAIKFLVMAVVNLALFTAFCSCKDENDRDTRIDVVQTDPVGTVAARVCNNDSGYVSIRLGDYQDADGNTKEVIACLRYSSSSNLEFVDTSKSVIDCDSTVQVASVGPVKNLSDIEMPAGGWDNCRASGIPGCGYVIKKVQDDDRMKDSHGFYLFYSRLYVVSYVMSGDAIIGVNIKYEPNWIGR